MKQPRVSIGLPVFNGETYLAEAIDSILAQSFTDFEIIISDNASTDRTRSICEAYTAQDDRIRYFHSNKNLGAAWNFNRVFELSRGEYFKWAADDDLIAPDFLEKCVTILDKDPSIVIAYSKVKVIDDDGEVQMEYPIKLATDSANPRQRYRDLLLVPHLCFEIFGLIRADALKQTPLIGNYGHGDGILLERLSLLGAFYEVPEHLFFSRRHSQQSMNVYGVYKSNLNDYHGYTEWFDPSKSGRIIFPTWRMLYEHYVTFWQSPLSWWDRLLCHFYMVMWILQRRKRPLLYDLIIASKQIITRLGKHSGSRDSFRIWRNL